MTTRKPLVIVSGLQQELPAGDNVADSTLAALDQILGYSSVILEVEANSKAARVVYRPFDGANPSEMVYDVGHYSVGFSGSFSATTSWTNNSQVCSMLMAGGIALLRKITFGCCTTAVVGTRVGAGRVDLLEGKPITGLALANLYVNPPIGALQGGSISANYNSLRGNQINPILQIESTGSLTTPNGGVGDTGSYNASKPIASHYFGVKNAVGNDLAPTVIFDAYNNNAPYVMGEFEGAFLGLTYPAAVTSQAVFWSVAMQWDEWTPRLPNTVL
jgi:hypothetical protein